MKTTARQQQSWGERAATQRRSGAARNNNQQTASGGCSIFSYQRGKKGEKKKKKYIFPSSVPVAQPAPHSPPTAPRTPQPRCARHGQNETKAETASRQRPVPVLPAGAGAGRAAPSPAAAAPPRPARYRPRSGTSSPDPGLFLPFFFFFPFFNKLIFPSARVLPSFPGRGRKWRGGRQRGVYPSCTPAKAGKALPGPAPSRNPPKHPIFLTKLLIICCCFFPLFPPGGGKRPPSPAHHYGSLLRGGGGGGCHIFFLPTLCPRARQPAESSPGVRSPTLLIGSLMARGKVCACHCLLTPMGRQTLPPPHPLYRLPGSPSHITGGGGGGRGGGVGWGGGEVGINEESLICG